MDAALAQMISKAGELQGIIAILMDPKKFSENLSLIQAEAAKLTGSQEAATKALDDASRAQAEARRLHDLAHQKISAAEKLEREARTQAIEGKDEAQRRLDQANKLHEEVKAREDNLIVQIKRLEANVVAHNEVAAVLSKSQDEVVRMRKDLERRLALVSQAADDREP